MKGYRADIDGLRAVSVLAVILFHAGLGVPGGFVGVDVFFVISGFLITRLIAADLEAGTFSLANFWERRIRRIWPASVAMTASTLAAGWFILMPADFADLGTDAVAQSLMVANVRFWRSADYFASAADIRALLHTWSLAVEEQFYVVYPALLWGAWRLGGRRVTIGLAVMGAASLIACQWAMPNHAMAAFYLLPFRAWELLVGAIIALVPPMPDRSARVRGPMSALGMLCIAAPCALYSGATPFPGLAAVLPCLGAALVIAAGGGSRPPLVNSLLSSAPLRTIGLMSYSLYLWHWPILAMSRYCLGHELASSAVAASLAATAVVSAVSWRFVEVPFRRSRTGRGGLVPVAAAGLLATLLVCGAGLAVRVTHGVPARIAPRILEAGTPSPFSRAWELRSVPGSDDAEAALPIGVADATPCFLFWGDSHGMAISVAIDEGAKQHGISGLAVLRAGAPSLPGAWNPKHWAGLDESQFAAVSSSVMARIRADRPRFVILCSRWWQYVHDPKSRMARIGQSGGSQAEAEAALESGLDQIANACQSVDAQLVVMLEVPTQRGPPQQRAAIAQLLGSTPPTTGIARPDHESKLGHVHAVIRRALRGRGIVIDLSEPFFDRDGVSLVGEPGQGLYWDADHISDVAARSLVKPGLERLFDRMAERCASP